jgi:hypothetical protein
MKSKDYFIAKLERNGINLVASGHSASDLNDKLKDSLKAWLITNNIFKNNDASKDPAYFVNEAQKLLDETVADKKLEIFNLSVIGEVFEGTKKISELVTKTNTSDGMRYWLFLWQTSKKSEHAGGVLGEIPTTDELRWLVTDSGFYITIQTPTIASPKTIDEKKKIINEFISHFEVAFKFGAPAKSLLIIAKIIKNAVSNFNEIQGNYSHLSIEELEVMLTRRVSLEMTNKAMGTNFIVEGLSVEELNKIIDLKKLEGAAKSDSRNVFTISKNLEDFINQAKSKN